MITTDNAAAAAAVTLSCVHHQDLANLVDILVAGSLATDIRRSTAEQLAALAGHRRFAAGLCDDRLLEALVAQLLASGAPGANFAQAQLGAAYLALVDVLAMVRLPMNPHPLSQPSILILLSQCNAGHASWLSCFAAHGHCVVMSTKTLE